MANYLITGTSRGIGLELTKQLLELPVSQVGKVFAATRSDPSAPLRDLINKNSDRVDHVIASVDDNESVQKAASDVKAKLGDQGLDVLVNSAGQPAISPGGTKTTPPEQLAHLFNVNVIGAHRVTAAFLPLLEKGNQKKVINLYVICSGAAPRLGKTDSRRSSTTLGSIALAETFRDTPTQAYKISKAALHMLNAQYALDHAEAGFTFLCVSPGVRIHHRLG